jgi:hypothetical protein
VSPPEARHVVGAAGRADQTAADQGEGLVAELLPEHLVDGGEAGDGGDQDADGAAAGQLAVEQAAERGAVEQAGEGVVAALVGERRGELGLLAGRPLLLAAPHGALAQGGGLGLQGAGGAAGDDLDHEQHGREQGGRAGEPGGVGGAALDPPGHGGADGDGVAGVDPGSVHGGPERAQDRQQHDAGQADRARHRRDQLQRRGTAAEQRQQDVRVPGGPAGDRVQPAAAGASRVRQHVQARVVRGLVLGALVGDVHVCGARLVEVVVDRRAQFRRAWPSRRHDPPRRSASCRCRGVLGGEGAGLHHPAGPNQAPARIDRADWAERASPRRGSAQLEQRADLLRGVPLQLVPLGLLHGEPGLVAAQVGGDDGLRGGPHVVLRRGVVDVHGQHPLQRHRVEHLDGRAVDVGSGLDARRLGHHDHPTSRRPGLEHERAVQQPTLARAARLSAAYSSSSSSPSAYHSRRAPVTA